MTVPLSPDEPFTDSTDENRIGEALPYEAPVEGAFPPDLPPPVHTQRPHEDKVRHGRLLPIEGLFEPDRQPPLYMKQLAEEGARQGLSTVTGKP